MKCDETYKNGNRDGRYATWYENGQKKDEGIYKGGKKEGLWISWFENGKIKYNGNYINDKNDGEFIEGEENGDQKTMVYKNGTIDIRTTNSVKYYKPAKNSKLLIVKSNNEYMIVNLIFEPRGINESDFYSYINDPANRNRFAELPESKYDTFKDLIINYKLYYVFYFEFQTDLFDKSLYSCTFNSQFRLMDLYNKKVSEKDYTSYSPWKHTKEEAISHMIYCLSYHTNEFIDEYFPEK